ncbi:MAG TPA: GAF domain-containing protein, partial [Conexibacter sp.]|nr:GAF domain-containing protein [Conexibacter sp.]
LAAPATNDVALLAEALGTGVRSMRTGAPIDINAAATYRLIGRTRGLLVQPDCRAGDPPPPDTLMDVYGVCAQVVAPLFDGDALIGSISVHQCGHTRAWSAEDRAAIAGAGALVQRMLGAERAAAR